MTPTYLNSSSSSPFPAAEYHNDPHHDHPLFLGPNNIYDDQAAGHATPSSSSYDLSTHIRFNSSSITTRDDPSVFYHKELQRPHVQQDQADNFDSYGGSYDIENYASTSDNGLKFSMWKKEDKFGNYHQRHHESTCTYKAKWMTSKMGLMHKMRNNIDPTAVNPPPSATILIKLENQIKESVSFSPMDTDNSSNAASLNNSTNPIRVCSDCNTTKTPLWRSGPQGPKSLCNACGIRQRKARRAMAAAAVAANGTSLEAGTTALGLKTKTKTEQKEKRASSTSSGHNVAKYKKRRSKLITSTGPTSSSHDHHQGRINKLCFEDFLLSSTNNLANFHQAVFPQDEKEAAILLMALSCDRAHG